MIEAARKILKLFFGPSDFELARLRCDQLNAEQLKAKLAEHELAKIENRKPNPKIGGIRYEVKW